MDVQLREAMMDATIAVGHALQVTLDANPGAGATWRHEGESADVHVERIASGTSTRAPGSTTEQVFRVTAHSPGMYQITFVYGRPWEPTVRAKRTLRLHAIA